MQDPTKLSSLRELMMTGGNALIEVDLEGPLRVDALLVENTSSDVVTSELDRVYRRYPIGLSREIVDTRDDVGVVDDLAELKDWDALIKSVIISSSKSFEWLNDIDSQTEAEGILVASSAKSSARPTVQVYQAMLYWECSSGPLWMEGLRSLFFMFLNEKCPQFYVHYSRYLLLFTRKGKPCCMIANYTSTLGQALRAGGVSIPEQSQEEMKVLGSKAASCIKISGNSLRALYNFLANSESDSRILAPVPFLNSTLRSLRTTFNGEISATPEELSQTSAFRKRNDRVFRWTLEGPITPASVKVLCEALKVFHGEFTIDIVTDSVSKSLNEVLVSKVSCNGERYSVTYFH